MFRDLRSATRAADAGRAAQPYFVPWSTTNCPIPNGNMLRKPQCDFGWDWNIALAPAGLYGRIGIVGPEGEIAEVTIEQPPRGPGDPHGPRLAAGRELVAVESVAGAALLRRHVARRQFGRQAFLVGLARGPRLRALPRRKALVLLRVRVDRRDPDLRRDRGSQHRLAGDREPPEERRRERADRRGDVPLSPLPRRLRELRLAVPGPALALFVTLEADRPGRFSTNAVTLFPGHPAEIVFTPADGDPAAVRLTTRDLWSSAQASNRGTQR